MCAVSMIIDHHFEKWQQHSQLQPNMLPYNNLPYLPTQEEIDEFHKLLDRAREYDKKHNQPDCELEEKKQKLKKLAEELGVDIHF